MANGADAKLSSPGTPSSSPAQRRASLSQPDRVAVLSGIPACWQFAKAVMGLTTANEAFVKLQRQRAGRQRRERDETAMLRAGKSYWRRRTRTARIAVTVPCRRGPPPAWRPGPTPAPVISAPVLALDRGPGKRNGWPAPQVGVARASRTHSGRLSLGAEDRRSTHVLGRAPFVPRPTHRRRAAASCCGTRHHPLTKRHSIYRR
jgi:hypothetical protein